MIGLAGCASAPRQDSAIDALRGELQEIKGEIAKVNTRLDSEEGKLAAMNDKVESARTTLDIFVNGMKPRATPVIAHPSEGAGESIAPKPLAQDPEAGFINDDAVEAFRKAMILFEAQKLPEAVLAFSGFIEKFPDHPLAGTAQYYVGESYAKQKEYKLALQEFERVLTSYDRSSRVADTLRDMASAEDALNKPEDAARHRQLLSSLFPQSPAFAKKARPETAAPAAAPGAAADQGAAPADFQATPPQTAPMTAPMKSVDPVPQGEDSESAVE